MLLKKYRLYIARRHIGLHSREAASSHSSVVIGYNSIQILVLFVFLITNRQKWGSAHYLKQTLPSTLVQVLDDFSHSWSFCFARVKSKSFFFVLLYADSRKYFRKTFHAVPFPGNSHCLKVKAYGMQVFIKLVCKPSPCFTIYKWINIKVIKAETPNEFKYIYEFLNCFSPVCVGSYNSKSYWYLKFPFTFLLPSNLIPTDDGWFAKPLLHKIYSDLWGSILW